DDRDESVPHHFQLDRIEATFRGYGHGHYSRGAARGDPRAPPRGSVKHSRSQPTRSRTRSPNR
ncbi:MAG TPA: hypothetical protein VH482_08550, partial [Thermomicrobiales bacterium]